MHTPQAKSLTLKTNPTSDTSYKQLTSVSISYGLGNPTILCLFLIICCNGRRNSKQYIYWFIYNDRCDKETRGQVHRVILEVCRTLSLRSWHVLPLSLWIHWHTQTLRQACTWGVFVGASSQKSDQFFIPAPAPLPSLGIVGLGLKMAGSFGWLGLLQKPPK